MEKVNEETITINREELRVFIQNLIADLVKFENEKLGLCGNFSKILCANEKFEDLRSELLDSIYDEIESFLEQK